MGVHFKENEEKITVGMIVAGLIIIAVLVASLVVYLININVSNKEEIAKEETKTGEVSNTQGDDFESVSIDIGKSVNEAENELSKNSVSNEIKENRSTNTTTKKENNSKNKENTVKNETKVENSVKEEKTNTEEPKFEAPIKGEIIKEFAKDSLVYSNTLEEWVTHNGVDIKADKTSVVKASSKGTVYAIKNDPRYGLTVIVDHGNGYKTVYANLLTAEYVVEGEEIEQGQTIGTVGNSSSFEISDDYHLHFELIKDGEYLNPSNFMEF